MKYFYLESTNADFFALDNFVISSGCLTPHEDTGGGFDPLGEIRSGY